MEATDSLCPMMAIDVSGYNCEAYMKVQNVLTHEELDTRISLSDSRFS